MEQRNFICRELKGFKEYEICFRLQQEIFNLSDKDTFSPALLNMLNRKEPKVGYAIGAFEKENMIGFFLATASIEPNTLYGVLMGVKPDYENQNVGKSLFLKLREFALGKNLNTLSFIYEPLEGVLGNFYFNKLGVIGVKYESDVFQLSNSQYPIDKLLVKWELNSIQTIARIKGNAKKECLNNLLKDCPVVCSGMITGAKKILVKIPGDFTKMKNLDYKKAIELRFSTRKIFNEYLNKRGYVVKDFFSERDGEQRDNYYLLEKD